MSITWVLAWGAFAYVLIFGLRYLFGVRMLLSSAYRDPRIEIISAPQLEPVQLQLLSELDGPLAEAHFRHLGYLRITPFLTSYDKAMPCSVFLNETVPAYAIVRPRMFPEYSGIAELQIQTTLQSGITVATLNTPVAASFLPPDLRVGAVRNAKVADLVEIHQHRVAAESRDSEPSAPAGLDDLRTTLLGSLLKLRVQLRTSGWTTPSADVSLDRYTLRGAFALTHFSRRLIGGRTGNLHVPTVPSSDAERQLRIEADMAAILAVAEHPVTAPGTAWPLITVVIATALLSFVAMSALWNPYIATVVLAAVAFHEGGHALAMRRFGYRDVQVFFVPLLGAMTVGRPAVSSVRDRIAVLLAGPTPGLWLGLVLFVVERTVYPSQLLEVSSRVLLVLNGLNLLPFTPLDGGRALEALTRPESLWRPVVHAVSALCLVAIGIRLQDSITLAFGAFWLVMLANQWKSWRLRREVAAVAHGRADFAAMARVTLEVVATHPRYASLRAPMRQMYARTLGRAFADATVTPTDRAWGVIAYATAWVPLVAWLMLNQWGGA